MERVCVFCGSSEGNLPEYSKQARRLGGLLAEEGIELIYGGGNIGLMGVLARSVIENTGKVVGIIPKDLYFKVKHTEITELLVVNNMHERKSRMYGLGDAFIAMPGGIGTLEELFEILTWQQLEYHRKPVALFNISGYFDKLLFFLRQVVDDGFLKQEHLSNLIISDDPKELILKIKKANTVSLEKW